MKGFIRKRAYALGLLVFCLPLWTEACPRCFQGTPYRTGLLWAAWFLMPVPFLLAGLLTTWIIRHGKSA